ncbi:MAG: PAS domain-containing protein [Desulfobacteraceae bacterium]
MRTEDGATKAIKLINEMAEKGQRSLTLKTSEALTGVEAESFTDIFLNSPIGIYIVQDGMLVYVNPEFQEISGYYEEELLNMSPQEIVHPDDWDMVKENAINMLKGKRSAPYLYRALDRTREMKWIIESVTSVQFKGKKASLGYFMDNTEGERAKEALRLSEEKFHKAFRSSPEWFVLSTLEDGFYIDVNEAFLRATGYTREEVIGRTSSELGIWVDPHQRDEIAKRVQEEGVIRDVEVQFRMKSGEIRHMLWSAELIDYGDEKCHIAMTRDITARRRAEEEKLQREKVQGVLETAGAACHELNQPLQFAFYLVDEILDKDPDSDTARELKKQLNRMKEITTKLDSITTYETTDYIRGKKIIDIHKACKNGEDPDT